MRRTLRCNDSSLTLDTFLLLLMSAAGCSLSAVIVREILGPAAYLCLDGHQILGITRTPVSAVLLFGYLFRFCKTQQSKCLSRRNIYRVIGSCFL